MAIPSRQIGWSGRANLLWQISKQLERLTCVTAGGCGPTTTTTTTSASTNYNVAGCERMEYHVITYNGEGVLPEGTIVNNATPECWFIIDQTTNPADVGTVTYVWPILGECSFCIDSHTTTTTTTTLFFYEFSSISSDISAENACTNPDLSPILYTLVEILTIGVAVYDAPELTSPANNGYYVVDGIVWHIVGGIITEDLGSC